MDRASLASMDNCSQEVLVGYLPVPVNVHAGRLTDLIDCSAIPSASGTRLVISKDDGSMAVSDAAIIADLLHSSSSSGSGTVRQLASVVWGFASVKDALQCTSLGSISSSVDGRGQLQCRTRVKALHMLLQTGNIQLKVVAVGSRSNPAADQQQQQQQQQLEQDGVSDSNRLQTLASGAAAAAAAAAATPNSKKRSSTKRKGSGIQAYPATAAAPLARPAWLVVSLVLLPEFFYTPVLTAAVPGRNSSSSSSSSSSRKGDVDQRASNPMGWTQLPEGTHEIDTYDITADQLMKAVNSLMVMLKDVASLQQQQQQQQQQHCMNEPDSDSDDEYEQITSQYQRSMKLQQQDQLPAAAAVVPSDQFVGQFDLYCCPDAAAAALTDIRQSLFEWVDSAPWKCERHDPPGLASTLYRYQRRALAWMVWREEHGTQPLGLSSSSSSSTDPCPRGIDPAQQRLHAAADDSAVAAAQGLLGAQLLNPLWAEVKLTLLPPPLLAAGGRGAACCQGDRHQQQQQQREPAAANVPAAQQCCCIHPPPAANGFQQQQQCVVLYHAVSHGLVSAVRPSGFCGPAGGVLSDEMGLGKTVEVLALLLARPPPTHIKGTRGLPITAAAHSDDYTHERRRRQQQQHQQRTNFDSDDDAEERLHHNHGRHTTADGITQGSIAAPAAAGGAAGVTGGPVWPAGGRWAGGTLVVTPPAILQQWVSEARRHAPGLTVEVYDGLKWQRAQAEAQHRKQQGRLGKGARQQQALLEQYNYIINGPPDNPLFDADADAAEAVQQLLRADVVLTTFDVLQQEVHFSGNNSDRLSSLRHKKRYAVPESPLLQVHWWRLVLDEAQLVGGGFSATAVMAARLVSMHRWAVTGTPIGGGGLDDVGNLLRFIGAAPFDTNYTSKKAIHEPFSASVAAAAAALQQQHQLRVDGASCGDGDDQHDDDDHMVNLLSAQDWDNHHQQQQQQQQQQCVQAAAPRYGRCDRDGVRRLLSLLQPLMWRSNKEAAAADHPLPPRHLQCAFLRFSPAEKSFYNHIVEKTAAANQQLQQQQGQQQQQQVQGDMIDLTGQQQQQQQQGFKRGRGHRRRAAAAAGGGVLEKQIQQVAAGCILQLRLACVHPQLTSYWRELSSELQLRQGGALSISEILGRMRDGAQLKLQQAERELCVVLNALADRLIRQADEAAAAVDSAAAVAGGKQQQGKKRRRSSSSGKGGRTAAAAAAADNVEGHESDDEPYEPAARAAAAAAGSSGGGSSNKSRKRVRFTTADGDGDRDVGMDAAATAGGSSNGGGSRHRSSSSGGGGGGDTEEGQSSKELQAAALKLLEDSYKVGEHGIGVLTGGSSSSSSSGSAPDPLGDISGGDATWRAWKHVGLHTAQSLSKLCSRMDLSLKSELYSQDVGKKRDELLETVTAELLRAQQKLNSQKSRVDELAGELKSHWGAAAAAAAVPMEAMTGAADATAWLEGLAAQVAAAKASEEESRQQHIDAQGTTVTTVLLGQHVPKLLETLEAAAAADRTLFEGVVGQLHTQKVSGLLRTVLRQLTSGTGGYTGVAKAGTIAGTLGDTGRVRSAPATGGDAAARRITGRAAAAAGDHVDHDRVYLPDHESASEDDEPGYELHRQRKRIAGSNRSTAGAGASAAGVAAWTAGSNLGALLQQQQPGAEPPSVSGAASEAFKAAAARAATYQFLDCLPERRVLWRLLFRGTLAPTDSPAATAPAASASSSTNSSGVTMSTPDSVATALGGLLQVYASTAFAADSGVSTEQHAVHDHQSAQHLTSSSGSVLQPTRSAAEYGARVCITQSVSLMRQTLRRVEKREAGFIRAVNSAAAAAPGGNDPAAAAALAAAYLQKQQQQLQGAAMNTAEASAIIGLSDVNIPLLLQQLPAPAVAAAAEAARVRVELCRAERDVYVAELGVEVSQHNRQLVEDEAETAAAGQLSQVLQLAHKSTSDLRRSVTELTKKCDELLRHKRFLANQAAESQNFGKGSKTNSAAATEGADSAATAAAGSSAGGQAHADLECAVCRSAMSDELRVFPCGHYFCEACADVQLSQPSPSCPYCRVRLTKAGGFRVSLAGSSAHDTEVDPPEGQAVRDMKVTGVWMTKVDALLRRVLLMRATDPTAKALVFSQFPDALVLASKALDVLKVGHVSLGLGGGKDRRMAMRAAVKAFNDDEDVCIFLLSLRAGSSGLTLTAASRVFLLEPGLDPAIEQQAVARVHRIGQEREVIITRLLVQGTIEEQVLQISENKQALLTEAAQQHHHHLGQQQQRSHPTVAAADVDKADLSDQEDTQTPAAAAAAAAAEPVGATSILRKRRRRSRAPVGVGAPAADGELGGTAGDAAAAAAATTLQSLAPKKEQLARDDVVGLLAAVMKQAGQQ